MGGNPANAESPAQFSKAEALTDATDEYLIRVVAFAFSLPPCAGSGVDDPLGWCSSCDSIWQNCEFKIVDCRPACPNCGDWLIFKEDEASNGSAV